MTDPFGAVAALDPPPHPIDITGIDATALVSLEDELTLAKAWRTHYREDIPPVARLYAGDRLVMSIFAPAVERDLVLQACAIAVPVIQPTEVRLWLDTHSTKSPVSPSGELWKAGEMQARCDGENLCATGLITDAIVVLTRTRLGTVNVAQANYHNHSGPGGQDDPAWIDDEIKEYDTFDGYIVDCLTSFFETELPPVAAEQQNELVAMVAPTIGLVLDGEALRRQVLACGVAKALSQIGYRVLVDQTEDWQRRVVAFFQI